jgi:hypothetical protein
MKLLCVRLHPFLFVNGQFHPHHGMIAPLTPTRAWRSQPAHNHSAEQIMRSE